MSLSSLNAGRALRTAAARLADLALPRDCIACGEPADGRWNWFCDSCGEKLPVTRAENACTACGLPFEGVVATPRRCPGCGEMGAAWDRGATLLRYAGPAENLVKRLKYGGEKALLADVARLLDARPDVLELLRGAIVAPVPLFSSRLRERGFNQSAWLADLFAEAAGASRAELLVRTRDTPTQTALSIPERKRNVRGAFEALPQVRAGLRYVLVDDVLTTGATLNACAMTLLAAGAERPCVLTLARA